MALERMGIGALFDFDGDAGVAAIGRAGRAVKGLQDGMGRMGQGARQVAGGTAMAFAGLAPAVLAAGGAAAVAVQRYGSFETELAKIGSLLDGGSAQAKGFTRDINAMAVQYGIAANDIAGGLFQAVSASVKAEEVIGFMHEASKAATAGFTQQSVAVDALSNVINAYGDQLGATATAQEKAAKLNDIIFYANKFGKTTFDEIARSIGNLAPTAALAGVPFQELAAGIAAMTATGISTRETVTALNQVLLSFVSPTTEAIKAGKKYGIEMSAATLKTHGLQGALALVEARMGGNSEALGELFGNVRAFKGAAVLAGTGAKAFTDVLQIMNTQGGITNRVFADVQQTLGQKFKGTLQALDSAARVVGQSLVEELGLGSLDAATLVTNNLDQIEATARRVFGAIRGSLERLQIKEKVGAIVDALSSLQDKLSSAFGPDTAQRLTDIAVATGVIVGAMIPLMVVVGPLIVAFSGLVTAASGIVTMFGGAGAIVGSLGTGLTALSAAAGPVAAVVGVLALAGMAIWDNFNGARDAVGAVGATLLDAWAAAQRMAAVLYDALEPTIVSLSGVFGGLINVLGAVWEIFMAQFMPVLELLWSALSAVISLIGAALAPLLTLLGRLLGGLGDALRKYVVPAFNIVGDVIRKVAGYLQSFVGEVRKGIDGMMKMLGMAEDLPFVSDSKKDRARDGTKAIAAGMTAGVQGAANVVSGAKAGAAGLLDKARNFDVGGALADAMGLQSKSKTEALANANGKQPINITSRLCVDGGAMNVASGKARLELMERAGAGVTPWQRRQIVERGAVTVGAGDRG